MPELPEVETIRRQLAGVLPNKQFVGVKIKVTKLIKNPLPIFKKGILKARVNRIRRRAKILVIELSNGYSMMVHLKMTGQLIYKEKSSLKFGGHPIKGGTKNLPNKFTHVIFNFKDGSNLFFNDLRRFGYLRLARSAEVDDIFKEMKLGPEPLAKQFTFEKFKQTLARRKNSRIKQALLDQTVIAGIGNIYATEACFAAGIKPTRLVKTLNSQVLKKLYSSIKSTIKQAVKKQGTSSQNYVDAYGEPGEYVPLLKVYGRKGKPCLKCRSIIKSLTLGGRGSAYCPKCQK